MQKKWRLYKDILKNATVTVYCLRFIKNCKTKRRETTPLKPEELEVTLQKHIKSTQLYFGDDISQLHKKKSARNLLPLTPFVDANGLVRVGRKLTESNLTYNEKHQYIIPKESHLANLIIRDAHARTLHGGNQTTLAYRRRKFWVINTKNKIRFIIHKCPSCIRHGAKMTTQLMGLTSQYENNTIKPIFLHLSGLCRTNTNKDIPR